MSVVRVDVATATVSSVITFSLSKIFVSAAAKYVARISTATSFIHGPKRHAPSEQDPTTSRHNFALIRSSSGPIDLNSVTESKSRTSGHNFLLESKNADGFNGAGFWSVNEWTNISDIQGFKKLSLINI